MIYTVTFNPSLDSTVYMPLFRAGAINRVAREAVYPGGKGINVGIILHRLGMPVRLLGFVAGFTGAEIERLAVVAGCGCDFIHLEKGLSRINVKIGAGKTVLAGEKKDAGTEVTEADLLSISDRMVLEDKFVGAEKRFEYLRNKIRKRQWSSVEEIVKTSDSHKPGF